MEPSKESKEPEVRFYRRHQGWYVRYPHDRHKTPSTRSPSWNWRVLESAGLLAVVTAALYVIGHSYYTGYFGRLSFPTPVPGQVLDVL